jgi:hypothetical protein
VFDPNLHVPLSLFDDHTLSENPETKWSFGFSRVMDVVHARGRVSILERMVVQREDGICPGSLLTALLVVSKASFASSSLPTVRKQV